MRRVKAPLGVLCALLVAGLATSAAAFAENGVLPKPTGSVAVTSGAGVFVSKSGLELKCKKDTGTATFESDSTGTFSVTLEECGGPLGVKCTGLSNATAGQNTVQGSFALLDLLGSSTLNGVVFSPTTTHFTCGGVLTLVRGEVVGKMSVIGSVGTITFKQSKGVNELTDTSTESGLILESSNSGGKFEQSGEETTETMTFAGGTELMG